MWAGCSKTAERIGVLFEVAAPENPRNIVLEVVPIHPQ